MRIIGVDPGYERLGIAILDKDGSKETLIHSECFKTPPQDDFPKRLGAIGKRVESVLKEFKPEALAIENLFIEKNQKTAMRVSEARGTILFIASRSGLSVHEYTPLQIKIAVTGYGKSDKKQVEEMVRRLLTIPKDIVSDDEIDAIAIAITGSASIR